jgi:hypothetical protein
MSTRWIIVVWLASCAEAEPAPEPEPEPEEPNPVPTAGELAAQRRWGPDVNLTSDPASQVVTYNFAWSIAADQDGRVHVVYYDLRGGAAEIGYRRSLDSGSSWQPAVALTPVDGSPSHHPSVATAEGRVYVCWHEQTPEGFRVLFRRSLDGGATWDPQVPLTDFEGNAHCSIAADGDRVQVFHGHGAEVVTSGSDDAGLTWRPHQLISEPGSYSWVPNVAVDGDAVYLAWVDYRDGNEEEYLRRSIDGGRTFEPAVRVSHDPADSWAPSIAVKNGQLHYFWFDRRDSEFQDADIEAKVQELAALVGAQVEPIPARDPQVYYLDDFEPRVGRKMNTIQAALPAWVQRGGDPALAEALFVEIQRRFMVWMTSWEIYYARSDDGGLTFGAERRLTNAPGLSQRPSVALIGNEVNIVWFDGRGHPDDIWDTELYAKRSRDRWS